ncbi:MAG TPA: ABC transporter substrate-binding protein [Stellaceae bacterium]|nr:ABC transporter substrate-binding protein [Stellaceae bacterium]
MKKSNRHETTRRAVLKGATALAGSLAMPAIVGLAVRRASAQGAGKIVKVAPEADLKILDPVWTTATITGTHGWAIYDTLFALDYDYKVHPQMVEKYEASEDGLTHNFKLREKLAFHDGTPVTSKDCVASIRRWGARFGEAKIMLERSEKLEATDDKTFVLKLKEPFGPVAETLAATAQPCFIMREQEASTDPFTAIKETVGSGPFIFVKEEWQPGNKIVYRKNPNYVPRSETASGYAGGKVVHIDRTEWTVIPDQGTQASALITGELDYLTNPVPDSLPQLRSSPQIAIGRLDPLGWQFHVRFNTLAKPFDNPKARQAMQLLIVSQQDGYLAATGYTGDLGKVCLTPFVCDSPNETMVGTERFKKYDPEKIKALFKEAGYNNEPIVLMDPTDQPHLHLVAQVLNEQMKGVGLNADMQSMDWSTLVTRRAVKAAPSQDKGGWNIFPTAWPSATMMDPMLNLPLDSSCDQKNWFGWPCDDEMQKLRLAYLSVKKAEDRKKAMDAIQARFFEMPSYAYAGQYFPPIAYRKDRLKGVIGMASPVYWNMEKA